MLPAEGATGLFTAESCLLWNLGAGMKTADERIDAALDSALATRRPRGITFDMRGDARLIARRPSRWMGWPAPCSGGEPALHHEQRCRTRNGEGETVRGLLLGHAEGASFQPAFERRRRGRFRSGEAIRGRRAPQCFRFYGQLRSGAGVRAFDAQRGVQAAGRGFIAASRAWNAGLER